MAQPSTSLGCCLRILEKLGSFRKEWTKVRNSGTSRGHLMHESSRACRRFVAVGNGRMEHGLIQAAFARSARMNRPSPPLMQEKLPSCMLMPLEIHAHGILRSRIIWMVSLTPLCSDLNQSHCSIVSRGRPFQLTSSASPVHTRCDHRPWVLGLGVVRNRKCRISFGIDDCRLSLGHDLIMKASCCLKGRQI